MLTYTDKFIGRKCGSLFVNLAFKRWLKDLLGNELYQDLDQGQISYKISSHDTEGERMRNLMKAFEIRKQRFTVGSRDIRLDLPEPLHNLSLPDRVNCGRITIP
jgi:hypothetical protein